MTRTLKALGLALLAVCTISAVAASSASAATDEFTCVGQATCDVTGTSSNFATTFGTKSSSLTLTCEHTSYSGTATSGASEITVTPANNTCRALSANDTHVDFGCSYVLKGSTTSNTHTTGDTTTDAPVSLNCNHTGSITITITGLCTITIRDTHNGVTVNQNLHGVTYDTEGSGSTADLKVTITVDTITYTTHGGFGCAFGGLSTTGTDGTLTGTATAKGYLDNQPHSEANHVGLTDHSV
jgi:hypothetical protein